MVSDDFPEFTPSANDGFCGAPTTTVHFQAESNPGTGAARLWETVRCRISTKLADLT